jgi:moderate conductance mechanosensitive channel
MMIGKFEISDPKFWDLAAVTGIRVLGTVVIAWFVRRLLLWVIKVSRHRFAAHITDPEQLRRAETLGRILRNLATVLVVLITGMVVLREFGVSVAPLLGAAGVVGLAIGFGAQSLMKDFVSGFFLLLENQVARGDVIEVAGKSGTVEDVRLRYVQLRDYEGNVHFIPNGLITIVTNSSRGFAYAVIEVGVVYGTDLTEAYAALRAVAQQLRADPNYATSIWDELEITGIERLDGASVTVRSRLRVRPLEQWRVRREFVHRLRLEFTRRGVALAQPPLLAR